MGPLDTCLRPHIHLESHGLDPKATAATPARPTIGQDYRDRPILSPRLTLIPTPLSAAPEQPFAAGSCPTKRKSKSLWGRCWPSPWYLSAYIPLRTTAASAPGPPRCPLEPAGPSPPWHPPGRGLHRSLPGFSRVLAPTSGPATPFKLQATQPITCLCPFLFP